MSDQARLEALADFLSIWTADTLLEDIATSLSCSEADALDNLLRASGLYDDAEALISAHAEVDDEGDDHYPGVCSRCGTTLVNEDCPNYGSGEEHA